MNLSAPFIARPIATSLLMAGILLVGIAAYPLLPVAPLPQVDFPTIQVSAQLPGASPETMASSVATPLERQFAQIPGVSQGAVVPDSVVQSGAEGSYALAIRPDDSVEIRPLRVTASQQGYSLVAAGLAEGDRVVVDGQYRLRNGSRIAETAKAQPISTPATKSLRPMTE